MPLPLLQPLPLPPLPLMLLPCSRSFSLLYNPFLQEKGVMRASSLTSLQINGNSEAAVA